MQPHRDSPRRGRASWSGALRSTNRVSERDATRMQIEREPISLPPIRQALPEQFEERSAAGTSSSALPLDRTQPRRPVTPSGYSHETLYSHDTTPAYSYGTPPDYSHNTSPVHSHRISGDSTEDLPRSLSYGALPDHPRRLTPDTIHGMLSGYPRRTSLELAVMPASQQRAPLEHTRETYFPHSRGTQPDYSHRTSRDYSHRSSLAHSPTSPRARSPGSPGTYSPGSPRTYSLETPRNRSPEASSDSHRPNSLKRKYSPFEETKDAGELSPEPRSYVGPRRAWPIPEGSAPESSGNAARRPHLAGERPWGHTMRPFGRDQQRPSSLSQIMSPPRNEQRLRPGSLPHILSPTSSDQREHTDMRRPMLPFPNFGASSHRAGPQENTGDINTAEPRHPSGDPHEAYCRDAQRRRYWETFQGQLPGQIYANRYRPQPLESGRPGDGAPRLPGSFAPYYQRGFMRHAGYGMPANSDNRHRRRRGNLPKETTEKLRAWFVEHLQHPYPTEDEKQELMRQTNLQMNQISNWFINARRRHLPALISNAQAESAATNSRPQDDKKEGRILSSESDDDEA